DLCSALGRCFAAGGEGPARQLGGGAADGRRARHDARGIPGVRCPRRARLGNALPRYRRAVRQQNQAMLEAPPTMGLAATIAPARSSFTASARTMPRWPLPRACWPNGLTRVRPPAGGLGAWDTAGHGVESHTPRDGGADAAVIALWRCHGSDRRARGCVTMPA